MRIPGAADYIVFPPVASVSKQSAPVDDDKILAGNFEIEDRPANGIWWSALAQVFQLERTAAQTILYRSMSAPDQQSGIPGGLYSTAKYRIRSQSGFVVRALCALGLALAIPLCELRAQPPAPVMGESRAGSVFSAPARSEHTIARLRAFDRRVRPGESFYLGLELDTDPEWHTYWINPGDSGLATSIRFELPPGLSAGPLLWPTPRRIFVPPLMSYGYGSDQPGRRGRVTLLTRIDVAADVPPGPIEIIGAADWLECKEICLPGEGRMRLPLSVERSPAEDAAIPETASDAVFAQLPRGLLDAGQLPPHQARARVTATAVSLEITGLPAALIRTLGSGDAYFFIESEGVVAHAEPQRIVPDFQGDGLRIEIPRDLAANQTPTGEVRGVLKFVSQSIPGQDSGPNTALDEAWYIRAPLATDGWFAGAGRALLMFVFALLGGALLNLMPCVLPVLSLKVLALIQSDAQRPVARVQAGLAFAAGVVASFLTLAGVLLALQAAGAAAGWGYQLQSPIFVLALSALVLVFALNLLGVYEITAGLSWLPAGLTDGSFSKHSGHFGAGVLATVLATPCTAPFMGTAMGFAFGQGPLTVLLIFTGLGSGMALPYLALAAFPGALAWLPKPGRWMESFKQFSGFLLMGTALWLLWIFGRLTGADAQTLAIAALLAVGICSWIYGRWFAGPVALNPDAQDRADDRPRRFRTRMIAALAFWSVFALGVGLGWLAVQASAPASTKAIRSSSGAEAGATGVGDWRVYSRAEVAALRAQGRPVFIDFTADWCLSCKVNEALTFKDEAVWRRMRELDITAFQADWTRQDPEITRALRSYGRSGVPLYVLYGPGASAQARILPEVLNAGLFLAELEKLQSPPPE